MKKHLTITALLFTALIQGCNFAPKYKRPNAEISTNWSSNLFDEDKINLDEKQKKDAINISWNRFFDNEELKNIIKTTLENNRDLKIAALNIEASQAFYNIKRADLFPSLNGEASFSRQRITKNATNFGFSGRNIIQNRYFVGVSAAFELDFFGRIRNLKEAALQDFLAQNEAKNALKISLIAQVSSVYLELANLKSDLKISQKKIDIYKKIYQLKERSLKSGMISQIELSQNKSDLENAISLHSELSSQFEQNKNQLLLLMAKKDDKDLIIVNLEEINMKDDLQKGLSSQVLLLRPDILQKEYELVSKNANIGAARAAFFPSISLTGSYGFSSADFSNLFSSGSRGSWNFQPALNIPIFEAGKNIANLKISELEKEIATENYQKTIQTAFKEVSDELSIKKSIHDQLKAQESISRQKELIYKLSQKRFDNGLDNYFTIAQVEIDFYNAKSAANLAKKSYYVNKVNLYKVLGGGFTN